MPACNVSPEINMTPLIDVLLVLLIIFMVISPMKPYQLEARVPQPAVENIAAAPGSMIVVSVSRTRELSLNSAPMSFDILRQRLSELMRQRAEADRIVFISGPDNIDYGFIVKVVDLVKGAGAQMTGLIGEIDRQ